MPPEQTATPSLSGRSTSDDDRGSPEKASRKHLIDQIRVSVAFRIAVAATLPADGVQDGKRHIV